MNAKLMVHAQINLWTYNLKCHIITVPEEMKVWRCTLHNDLLTSLEVLRSIQLYKNEFCYVIQKVCPYEIEVVIGNGIYI